MKDAIDRFIAKIIEEDKHVMTLDNRGFVRAIGYALWNAPWESYSRFQSKADVSIKNGTETLESVLRGDGGICFEKNLALLAILRRLDFNCDLRFATAFKEGEKLPRRVKDKDYITTLPYHCSVFVDIKNETYIVDSAGGSAGYLFIQPRDVRKILSGEKEVCFRTYSQLRHLHYHDSSLSARLRYMLESSDKGAVMAVCMDHPLYVQKDVYVSARFSKRRQDDRSRVIFRCGRRDNFIDDCGIEELNSILGRELCDKILAAFETRRRILPGKMHGMLYFDRQARHMDTVVRKKT